MRALKWLPVGVAVAIATGVAVADVGGLTGGAGGGTTITDTLAMTGTTTTNLITSATTAATMDSSTAALTVKPTATPDSGDLIFAVKLATNAKLFSVNDTGQVVFGGGAADWSFASGTVTSGKTGDTSYLKSSIAAATATATTKAAWSIKPTGVLDADDMVLNVTKSDDTNLFRVDVEGDTFATGLASAAQVKVTATTGGGTISLSGGTGTATVLSGHRCVCTDTTANVSVKCAVSGTTLTATGTTTDVIAYFCF
jgi:hypothetical protein